jgi:hypothetical protein
VLSLLCRPRRRVAHHRRRQHCHRPHRRNRPRHQRPHRHLLACCRFEALLQVVNSPILYSLDPPVSMLYPLTASRTRTAAKLGQLSHAQRRPRCPFAPEQGSDQVSAHGEPTRHTSIAEVRTASHLACMAGTCGRVAMRSTRSPHYLTQSLCALQAPRRIDPTASGSCRSEPYPSDPCRSDCCRSELHCPSLPIVCPPLFGCLFWPQNDACTPIRASNVRAGVNACLRPMLFAGYLSVNRNNCPLCCVQLEALSTCTCVVSYTWLDCAHTSRFPCLAPSRVR